MNVFSRLVGRGRWTRSVRASTDEILMDVEWLHATLEWLILGDPDPDVSRPTMARKAHDKIDRLGALAMGARAVYDLEEDKGGVDG